MKYCLIPDCTNPVEGNTDKCATHNLAERKANRKVLKDTAKAITQLAQRKAKKPIKAVSKGMTEKLKEYTRLKKEFLVGKICPIYPHLKCVDIHHRAGRTGDLLLDTRYWLAVSRKGHVKIELNPRWARENNYSLPRN